jgi:serine protease Do
MTPGQPRHAFFVAAAIALTFAATVEAEAPPAAPLAAAIDFSAIATSQADAVVAVRTRQLTTPEFPTGLPEDLIERLFEQRGMEPQPSRALGSGFFVSDEGHIVTNHHVVASATEVEVILASGVARPAEIVGSDPETDLAVLRVALDPEETEAPAAARWGDSDALQPGAWTIAVGSPFGLGGTVTVGVLSARQRDLEPGSFDGFLQTDAAINVGNSGGPLFNIHGEVVGVNTAIYSPTGASVGIGFAVPSRTAEPIVSELIESGAVRRGAIGADLQDLDPALARALGHDRTSGALIGGLAGDSAAARAGLERGDLVVEVEGEAVADARSVAFAIAALSPGDQVRLRYLRPGGELREAVVDVTLKTSQAGPAPALDDAAEHRMRLGLSLRPLPERLRTSASGGAEGVVVARVRPGGLGEEVGLRPGDLILEAGRLPVSAPDDVTAAWDAAREAAEPLLLRIERAGASRFVAIEG